MTIGREAFIKKSRSGKCLCKLIKYFYLIPLRFAVGSFNPVFFTIALPAGNILSEPYVAYHRLRFTYYGPNIPCVSIAII